MINKKQIEVNNKSQFFSVKEKTKIWLDNYDIENYTINDDLSVDVDGSVDISDKNLKTIPVKFGNVMGSFWCQYNKLISLDGSPKSVGGSFDCSNNQLIGLIDSPKFIGGDFWCENNPLISLVELVDCNFKQNIYFDIDEKNFKQKELIEVLQKHYISIYKCYELTEHQFNDIIKPALKKDLLQQKLINSRVKNERKPSFI